VGGPVEVITLHGGYSLLYTHITYSDQFENSRSKNQSNFEVQNSVSGMRNESQKKHIGGPAQKSLYDDVGPHTWLVSAAKTLGSVNYYYVSLWTFK
jgi:hypothetical protein